MKSKKFPFILNIYTDVCVCVLYIIFKRVVVVTYLKKKLLEYIVWVGTFISVLYKKVL